MTETYELPPGANIQPIVVTMAQALGLQVVATSEMVISISGHGNDHAIFADRLEQLTRLCK